MLKELFYYWVLAHMIGGAVSFIISMYILLNSEREDMEFIRNILSKDPLNLLRTITMNMIFGQIFSWYDVSNKIRGLRSGIMNKTDEEVN